MLLVLFTLVQDGRSQPTPSEDRAEKLKEVAALKVQANSQIQKGELNQAATTGEKVLALEQTLHGQDSPALVRTLQVLIWLHQRREDWDAALKASDRVLAIRRNQGGDKHWQTADARLERELTGQLRQMKPEQRQKYWQALDMHNRALDLRGQGKPKEGLPLAGEAAARLKEVLGDEHLYVARAQLGVADLHSALRDWKSSCAAYEVALAIRRKVLPEGHPDIANSLNALGNVLRELRDHAGARKCHEEALAIHRKALPEGHPDIAKSLNGLGSVLHDLQDYAGTRKRFEEALAIRRKALPEGHLDIAHSLYNLGTVLAELREYAGARKCHEEGLAIRRKALPEGHPDIASASTTWELCCMNCVSLRERGSSWRRRWPSAARPCPRGTYTSQTVSTTWELCCVICGTMPLPASSWRRHRPFTARPSLRATPTLPEPLQPGDCTC